MKCEKVLIWSLTFCFCLVDEPTKYNSVLQPFLNVNSTWLRGKSTSGDMGTSSTKDTGKFSPGDAGKSNLGDTGKSGLEDIGKSSFGDAGKSSSKDTGKSSSEDAEKFDLEGIGKSIFGDTGKSSPGDIGESSCGDMRISSSEDAEKSNVEDIGKSKYGDTRKSSSRDTGKHSSGDTGKSSSGDTRNSSSEDAEKSHLDDKGKSSLGDMRKSSSGDAGKSNLDDIGKSSLGDMRKSSSGDAGKSCSGDTGKPSQENTGHSVTNDQRQCVTGQLAASPDFSELDYLIWIEILSYLNQVDRIAVANTCTTLRQYCLSESCLWRSLKLFAGFERHTESKPNELKFDEVEKQVMQASRGKVQHVEIIIDGLTNREFDAESFQCIDEASKTWPLKSFACRSYVRCQYCRYFNYRGCPFCKLSSSVKQILINCLTSESVSGLETLRLCTTCLSSKGRPSTVLKILKNSPFSHNLKTLLLGWSFLYCSFHSFTKSYKSTLCSAVGRFINLQELKIQSVFLTDKLLETLSQPGRASLQRISLLCETFHEKLSSWPLLLGSSPSLEVMIFSTETLKCESISQALPACVPVVEWHLVNLGPNPHTYCDPEGQRPYLEEQRQVLKLLPMYAEHLKCLYFEQRSLKGSDEDLLLLVRSCTKLKALEFDAKISSNVILKIAALQRDWEVLNFRKRAITFPQTWRGSRKHRTARLCNEVSELLGYPWTLSPIYDDRYYNDTELEERRMLLDVEPKLVSL